MAKSSKPATPAKKPASGPSASKSKAGNGGKPAKPAAKPAPVASKPAPSKPAPAKPATKSSDKKAAPLPTSAKTAKKPEPAPASAKGPAKPEAKSGAQAGKSAPAPAGKSAPAPAAKEAAKAPAAAAPNAAAGANASKVPPKGITIVQQRPMRKPKPKKLEMPISEPLLKPGGKWKPLIPSGPKAPPTGLVGHGTVAADPAILSKNKLSKKELDKYRDILLAKRAELVGDISNIEDEALRQNSGSLSSLPQHMAEQGSDTSDQSIALDLAQVDRNLIREIDEALKRIDEGTYGLCLRTGQRISAERLTEIPWAKYSIEAQRDLERRPYRTE